MQLPEHIAIIMDGNGRWAQLRRKERTFGHIKGARTAKKIITHCSRLGVKYLTLYAFSSENWLRPMMEVQFLMTLLRRYLRKETLNLVKENIRFSVMGDLSKLPADIQMAIAQTQVATQNCTGLQVCFALSYGSRQELVHSVQKIAQQIEAGEIKSEDVTEELIHENLFLPEIPDPDLILRTSGEKRLSNFLLWQAAYSEFYFSNALWPDFTTQDLDIAIASYLQRERRYGAIVQHENPHH